MENVILQKMPFLMGEFRGSLFLKKMESLLKPNWKILDWTETFPLWADTLLSLHSWEGETVWFSNQWTSLSQSPCANGFLHPILLLSRMSHTLPYKANMSSFPKGWPCLDLLKALKKPPKNPPNHRGRQQTRPKSSLGRCFFLWPWTFHQLKGCTVFISRAHVPADVVCFHISAPLFFNVATTFCLQSLVGFLSFNSVIFLLQNASH